MASTQRINPEILKWARETAGLSIEAAAEKMGLTSTERASAVEKLEQFESGERLPTRNQLGRFSAVYRRPLLTFYRAAPPVRAERGEDFRTIPATVTVRDNALLDTLLRDIKARQEMVRSLLEEDEESPPLPFVASMSINSGVNAVANSIAATLEFDVQERATAQRNIGAKGLFRKLRSRAEDVGIFVLLIGDLGSHHSVITEKVFRGFAIADKYAPFVVINDQDAETARAFTLLHELAHIWLGKTGVSGAVDLVDASVASGRIEQFCNDVAGELLLPSTAFQERPADLVPTEKESAKTFITQQARKWCVSEPMVAYKLHRIGWITPNVYRTLTSEYAARWAVLRQRMRDSNRDTDGGPNYYVVRQFKLGNGLIDVVRRTLRDNLLTPTKAAKVLGVKPSSVERLVRSHEARGPVEIGV